MKTYLFDESDMQLISMMNTLTTAGFSIGTVFLTFAASIYTGAILQGALTVKADTMVNILVPMFVFIGFMFYALGTFAYFTRKSTVDRIRDETTHE